MKATTIYISARTDFNKLIIDDSVYKIKIEWDSGITEKEKDCIKYSLNHFIFGINYKYQKLRVLDISELLGLKEISICGVSLYELICPYTAEVVHVTDVETIRYVNALGARSIWIAKAPNLINVEYGDCLEKLRLENTGITNIIIRKGIKLKYISFKDGKALKHIFVPDGIYLRSATFAGCVNLEEVHLPNDMLVLEPEVFKNCKKLKTIRGGRGIKHVFPSAFYGCESLEFIESVSFMKYTDLSISDKEWYDRKKRCDYGMSIFDNTYPINNYIKDTELFATSLKEKHIENQGQYLEKHFFKIAKRWHVGIAVYYVTSERKWIIWSLNHKRFFLSSCIYARDVDDNIRTILRDKVLFEFEYDDTPTVMIEDSIYLQKSIKEVDLLKIKQLSDGVVEYEDVVEYYHPSESLLQKYLDILEKVNGLDISSIINSYAIETYKSYQRRLGRDDFEWYVRIAKSDYSDAYIEKILPQENVRNYSYGDGGCWAEDDAEKESVEMQTKANEEAEEIKNNARRCYSQREHVCTLLEEFINKRSESEKWIEDKYHIKMVCEYLCEHGFHGIDDLYNITIDDILEKMIVMNNLE